MENIENTENVDNVNDVDDVDNVNDVDNLDNIYIACPICHTEHSENDIFNHIFFDHPDLMLIISSIVYPLPQEENVIFNTYINMYETQEEDEESSYAFYLRLCEILGDHKIGTKNIDYSAPIASIKNIGDICVICRENMDETTVVRQIRGCQHMYCSECITTWLSMNKTCPICKQEIEEENEEENNDCV
jgi:hypothetical protein